MDCNLQLKLNIVSPTTSVRQSGPVAVIRILCAHLQRPQWPDSEYQTTFFSAAAAGYGRDERGGHCMRADRLQHNIDWFSPVTCVLGLSRFLVCCCAAGLPVCLLLLCA